MLSQKLETINTYNLVEGMTLGEVLELFQTAIDSHLKDFESPCPQQNAYRIQHALSNRSQRILAEPIIQADAMRARVIKSLLANYESAMEGCYFATAKAIAAKLREHGVILK